MLVFKLRFKNYKDTIYLSYCSAAQTSRKKLTFKKKLNQSRKDIILVLLFHSVFAKFIHIHLQTIEEKQILIMLSSVTIFQKWFEVAIEKRFAINIRQNFDSMTSLFVNESYIVIQ